MFLLRKILPVLLISHLLARIAPCSVLATVRIAQLCSENPIHQSLVQFKFLGVDSGATPHAFRQTQVQSEAHIEQACTGHTIRQRLHGCCVPMGSSSDTGEYWVYSYKYVDIRAGRMRFKSVVDRFSGWHCAVCLCVQAMALTQCNSRKHVIPATPHLGGTP